MQEKPEILLNNEIHKGMEVITFRFPYNKDLINQIKKISGIRWSQSKKAWYIEKEEFHLSSVFDILSQKAFVNYKALKDHQSKEIKSKTSKTAKTKVKLPQAYRDNLEQRRYSKSTKATYINYFEDFIRYFNDRHLEKITVQEINDYILKLIRKKNISASQQNQRINAIKFYYEKVLGREKMYIDIKRPIKKKILPNVLSAAEIKKMIDVTDNLKHKCIISLLYSAGLRRSELLNLKITDILSQQMLIKIEQSKGNKDRYVGLSKFMLTLLRKYFIEYKPDKWLFEGQKGDQYSFESVGNVVKKAAKKAGINRTVTPHMLRHSFATHHLESGTDLRYIQEFLGHNSSKTTEIYTHVAKTNFNKFKNPLDEIFPDEK